MKNIKFSNFLFILGVFILFSAYLIQLVITSDIPVNFSISEAIFLQLVLFISTVLFIFASILLSKKSTRYVVIAIFTLIFVVTLSSFLTDTDAEYFTVSYALLTLPFVLQPLLLVLLNEFLIIKFRKITE